MFLHVGLLHRYTLETNRNHLAVQCAGITFQRTMTPAIGTITAFLTYLEHRSQTALFMIIIHHEVINRSTIFPAINWPFSRFPSKFRPKLWIPFFRPKC